MSKQTAVAIMQPYFLPYMGYWQLMEYVDRFVVYDNIQFSRRSWVHRNRYLMDGKDRWFTLPLRKQSDYLDIVDRHLSADFHVQRDKMLRTIKQAYRKAPFYAEGMDMVEEAFKGDASNLFSFIYDSIRVVRNRLGINTEIIISSSLDVDRELRAQDRVIATCKATGATQYINPPGGVDLYERSAFEAEGIQLSFQRPRLSPYNQGRGEFMSNLSVLDVVMYTGIEGTRSRLGEMGVG